MDLRLPFKNKKAMPCIAAATDKARLDFGSHYHLRTASDVKSYARFEFSDPKYLHIAAKELCGLWGHYGLQTALEVQYVLIFEISECNYLFIHVHIAYMVWALLAASEATTASKQPRRSNLTS